MCGVNKSFSIFIYTFRAIITIMAAAVSGLQMQIWFTGRVEQNIRNTNLVNSVALPVRRPVEHQPSSRVRRARIPPDIGPGWRQHCCMTPTEQGRQPNPRRHLENCPQFWHLFCRVKNRGKAQIFTCHLFFQCRNVTYTAHISFSIVMDLGTAAEFLQITYWNIEYCFHKNIFYASTMILTVQYRSIRCYRECKIAAR